MTTVVLGAQWGDEGKGKLVDILAGGNDLCARFNGGSNAGHTLVVGGRRVALHVLPCGVLHPATINLLGHGMVLHLPSLMDEIALLDSHIEEATNDEKKLRNDEKKLKTDEKTSKNDEKTSKNDEKTSTNDEKTSRNDEDVVTNSESVLNRILLSERTQLLFEAHKRVDAWEENGRAQKVGTTRRGIGPCYANKVGRHGARLGDLFRWREFEEKYRSLMSRFEAMYGRLVSEDEMKEELKQHKDIRTKLQSRIVDLVQFLNDNKHKKLLVEGANAAMLDIDFGTYPFVTSCTTTIGGVCSGLGIPPHNIAQVIGVVKAYATRVGTGFFPTELHDENGKYLQSKGHEFGTTTGRPRRCGWLDLASLRYVAAINGFTAINLTKLDVLTGLETLKICTGYRDIKTGEEKKSLFFPFSEAECQEVEPIYLELMGWTETLDNCKSFSDLPAAAQTYVQTISEAVNVKIKWIGVGPDRDHMLTHV